MRRVKSTLSSLSNFVESMLDDEYEDYRPIVRKIENPAACAVREKTVLEEERLQKLTPKQRVEEIVKNLKKGKKYTVR